MTWRNDVREVVETWTSLAMIENWWPQLGA